MKSPWKELFLLFREERKQLLLFIILLLFFLIAKWFMPYWYPQDEEFFKRINIELTKAESKSQIKSTGFAINKKSVNVNTNDTNDWVQLGFSRRQSEIILNFKNIIGGFKSRENLKKVFIIDDEKYALIEPLLLFNDTVAEVESKKMNFKASHNDFKEKKNLKPTRFNPNIVSEDELLEMGFSKRQIRNLINYRKSGGKFYKKDDVAKLYAINDAEFEILEDFIILNSNQFKDNLDERKVELVNVELNSCDSLQLISVNGIGAYYAHQILEYRNKLGGYHSKNQLYEIKYIRSESFEKFMKFLTVDTLFPLVKMDLNSEDFKGFLRHPYFDYYHTKKIFDFKNKTGKFTSLRDLKKVGFIEPDYVDKILPYLKIEE